MSKAVWIAAGAVGGTAAVVAAILAAKKRRSPPRGCTVGFPSFTSGREVTRATLDADGWVREAPRDLARAAGVDVETYTLARTIGSEWASGNACEKLAVAWAVLNRARRAGRTLLRRSTTVCVGTRGARECSDTGLYGRQQHPRWHGRPRIRAWSTARDPTDRDVWIATMALSGELRDPTDGADQFFNPAAQAALHERDPSMYRTPEDVIALWTSEGQYVRPTPPGVDGSHLVLLGPATA